MNTKIILSLGATALLASTLLANPAQGPKCDKGSCNKQQMSKQHKKGNSKGKGENVVRMFKKLNLTDEQKTKIRAIIKDSMNSVPNPSTAFTDNSFDMNKFIELSKQKQASKIERRAQMIQKVYSVLTDEQKKDFKTMLDMKDIMKKNHHMRK